MKETDEIEMQVDVEEELLSSENKENILHGIRKMSRKDLEELVLSKIVEAIIKHSEVGKFRTKIFEMQMYKEKLQNRVTHLLKQVYVVIFYFFRGNVRLPCIQFESSHVATLFSASLRLTLSFTNEPYLSSSSFCSLFR